MSHLHRFYIPDPPLCNGQEAHLPEDEAHHALSVVRLRDGESVALFDGKGTEAVGPLYRRGKRSAFVAVERVRTETPPSARVILAPAWLHRDKPMEEIIRRGTELGVHAFAFWRAERSQRPASDPEKWRRLAIECCKQSGRLHLPLFPCHDGLEAALSSSPGCILAADMHASAGSLLLPDTAADSCLLVIGPEGDFSEMEQALLSEHRAMPVSLGPYVLRTEVAAVALATLALGAFGCLGTRLSVKGDPPV